MPTYRNLLKVLQAYQDAFEHLFGQCASNPIRNAWGQQIDMTKLNEARRIESTVKAEPYVHKKTGGKYHVLGTARIQSDRPLKDMDRVIVYAGDDTQLWARETNEFTDRFAQGAHAPVDAMQSQFNAAIDFAIQQGSSAAEFLESWREGDTSEWPEFTTKPGDAA